MFVGLRSKIYSKKYDVKESNTAKGLNITIEFSEFKDTLFNKKIIRHKLRRIQAKKHEIGTYEIDKISLSCYDGKRFVLDDGKGFTRIKTRHTLKSLCSRIKSLPLLFSVG